MNCPYCGSTHLEESSNFNEYSCNFCKCEFKNDEGKVRIFEDGNYKKFCESVMYNLCESASPKVSNILVSVISQLKNNGVEEIDAILEHLMLVSANVSSEMVIGLQTEADLEVVQEGIKHFTSIGNTLLKRDDLELDLQRFTRFQEANSFYEATYPQPKTISVDGHEVVAGAVDENVFKNEIDSNGEIPMAPEASATDLPVAGIPRAGGGVVGGVSDNLPGAMDNIGDVDDVVPPVAQAPMEQAPLPPVDIGSDPAGEPAPIPGVPPEGVSQDDFAASFAPEELNKIAEVMANAYRTGAIAEDADFMESLMNCEAANGLCEDLGTMSEEQVYEVAQKVQEMLSQPSTPEVATGLDEVSPEQLEEALEILTKSAKLMNGELKDL